MNRPPLILQLISRPSNESRRLSSEADRIGRGQRNGQGQRSRGVTGDEITLAWARSIAVQSAISCTLPLARVILAFLTRGEVYRAPAALAFDHPRTEVRLTLRWREMDSNFQYAGAVNLVVGPFGWVVLCDRVRVRARRFWDSAVSATQLGDLSRRRRGGPPHRSIDEGSVTGLAGAMAPDTTGSAAIRPFACERPRAGCLRR